jgi:hypothetical protein
MPRVYLANNAKSTLSVAVTSNTQASLTLQTGHGARFPSPANPDHFYVTLDDGTNVEVCRIVAVSGDVLTALRGMDGTTAQASFATGTKCELRLTADVTEHQTFRALPRWKYVRPLANVASYSNMGMTLPTIVGSQIAATLTNSSVRETNERIRMGTANSAQVPAHWRIAQPTISGQAGYKASMRFGFAAAPNSCHFFAGWVGTTSIAASLYPPSSLQNAIVIGFVNSGLNANLSIWRCDSGTPATQLDLGSYFTVQTPAWYEFQIENRAESGGSKKIIYSVRRLDVSSIATATSYFTTAIPDNSLWLSPMVHGCSLVTSALLPEFGGVFVES